MFYSGTFGQWLTHKRTAAGLSQAELARRAEIARATISLYEKDAIHQPRLHQLDKIADIFGIGHDEIRAAFASLSINIGHRTDGTEEFEVMDGVIVGIDRKRAKLTPSQVDEIVNVLKLIVKGVTSK